MLIPSRKQVYTKRWSPLGQRRIDTRVLIAFNNNIAHQFCLSWVIREDLKKVCHLCITGEKILSIGKSQMTSKSKIQYLKSVDAEKLHGKETDKVAFMSVTGISEPLQKALIAAGILEDVSQEDAIRFARKHVQNVEAYINKSDCHKIVKDWLDSHNTIGIQRIIPKDSLFSSNIHISSCRTN
jgi:hypothetical protein